jgi:hypothetical protein
MIRQLLLLLVCVFSLSLCSFAQTKQASSAYKVPEKDCAALKLKINNFITGINKVPGTSGLIIVYEGSDEMVVVNNKGQKTTRQILPRVGEIDHQISSLQEMVRSLNAPVDKIRIINGGFRKKFAIEFWAVPKGAAPPKPTPNLKRMKYQKEKFSPEFPYWDC